MSIKYLISITLTFALAGSALAQQTQSSLRPKTRDEVKAELMQSKADGSYDRMHSDFVSPADGFISKKTREEVQNELKQAQQDGSLEKARREYYRN